MGEEPRSIWLVALVPLAALAAVALQFQQRELWPAPWYWGLAALGGALAMAVLLAPRPASAPIWCLALAALAFGSTGWRAEHRLAARLAPAFEGQDLLVTGVVAGLPQHHLAGIRFVFAPESAERDGQRVELPRRLALGWHRGVDADALLGAAAAELRAGQRWRLTLRLRQPHGQINPHGFDYELWLFEQGIGATGYVRSRPGAANDKLQDDAAFPVQRLRQRIRDAIFREVADPAAAGVLAALAVGDQSAIDRDDWELFRTTGVAHLMSISGLHVTMFAWLAGGLAAMLWRRSSRLALWRPAPSAGRWGGLAAAAAYALLAGWGVPAQRTVWMIATVVLLREAGLRWPQPLVLLAAACVVAAFDPWALLQPGFWLSFVAVAILIASEPVGAATGPSARLRTWVAAALRAQAAATLGLAPLTLVFFQQVSVVGFGANLLAIPLVTLLITPLALLGLLVPLLWQPAAWAVQGLAEALRWLASAPVAAWSAPVAPAWGAACGLLGGFLFVLPLPWRLRLLGVPLVLPLLAPPVQRPAPGQFEAVVADVGQGTAVLVRTASHLLVYDTGPMYSPEADAGQRVLLPLLRARGEAKVDLLMLSHRDSDHVGGAASLLARGGVQLLSSSLGAEHTALGTGAPHRACAAGQAWEWDGVRFEVLHPLPGEAAAAVKPNWLSCVLRVQGDRSSLLLTGDIEAPQEAALVVREGAKLRSDLLVVPHHGSRTSSTPEFIAAVSPRLAVVQAGYRSRFGHPAPDVMQRYADRGVEVRRSDRCGALTLAADGTASCERVERRRYWHHRAP